MSNDTSHPANPYADEAANTARLEDRSGYPSKQQLSAYATDLSDAAQLGRLGSRCEVCGKFIAPGEAYSDSRGGPWHRLCTPSPDEMPAPKLASSDKLPAPAPGYVRISGRVKWFDPIQGYGFIAPDEPGIGDVMLTADVLRASRYWPRVPAHYVRITADAMQSNRGWKAACVLRIDYID